MAHGIRCAIKKNRMKEYWGRCKYTRYCKNHNDKRLSHHMERRRQEKEFERIIKEEIDE